MRVRFGARLVYDYFQSFGFRLEEVFCLKEIFLKVSTTSVWARDVIFCCLGTEVKGLGHLWERIVRAILLFGLWRLVLCSSSIQQTAVYSY